MTGKDEDEENAFARISRWRDHLRVRRDYNNNYVNIAALLGNVEDVRAIMEYGPAYYRARALPDNQAAHASDTVLRELLVLGAPANETRLILRLDWNATGHYEENGQPPIMYTTCTRCANLLLAFGTNINATFPACDGQWDALRALDEFRPGDTAAMRCFQLSAQTVIAAHYNGPFPVAMLKTVAGAQGEHRTGINGGDQGVVRAKRRRLFISVLIDEN